MQTREQYKNILKFIMSFIVWGLTLIIWGYVWWHEYRMDIYAFGYRGSAAYIGLYGVLEFFFTSFYGGYKIGHYRREDVAFSGVLGLLITNGTAYSITCLVARRLISGGPMIVAGVIQLVVVIAWAYIANAIYVHIFPPYKMLMVYGRDGFVESLMEKMIFRSEKYSIQESMDISEGISAAMERINCYNAVVLCDLPPKMRNRLLKYCFERSIRTYTTPKISDIIIRGAENINLFDTPILLSRNIGPSLEQRFIKRLMDLIVSGLGLLIALPLILLISIAIKIYDGGPVFFKQKRCTLNNENFILIKFRSMVVDAEKDGEVKPAIENDPRITPIGRLLRTARLDEIPQLWNILKGDMSFVGPRPERVEHVEEYTKKIPEFVLRSKVKAGLTGYAQVIGRYNTSAYDKLKMDLMYIVNYSLTEDIKLMLMTVKVLFSKNSTEGFKKQ